MSLTVNIKNLSILAPDPAPAIPQVFALALASAIAGSSKTPPVSNSPLTAGADIQATTETRTALLVSHTRVAADGQHLPPEDTTTPHVAVIDHNTGLMWSVESLGKPGKDDEGLSQQDCEKRCAELRLLGFDDWRLPTRAELVTLIDDTLREPAIDPTLFPRVKPRWHWTSTPTAWSSASAWRVYFVSGLVSFSHGNDGGFALAVRRRRSAAHA